MTGHFKIKTLPISGNILLRHTCVFDIYFFKENKVVFFTLIYIQVYFYINKIPGQDILEYLIIYLIYILFK